MVDRCDFTEQTRVEVEGGTLRPDLVVHLPGEKQVVVDSKVPLQAYLDAHQATDEGTKQSRLAAHAADVRRHVRKLSEKGYAAQFESGAGVRGDVHARRGLSLRRAGEGSRSSSSSARNRT